MGCNINHVTVLCGPLTIKVKRARKFLCKHKGRLPGCNVFDLSRITDALAVGDDDDPIDLAYQFWWSGEFSGTAYNDILGDLLRRTKGSADLVFHWEGGDLTGLRVTDGKVTTHTVIVSLGEECQP